MHRLRAGWLSFRRIHLAALIADWRRTLLSVIGVAMGVTVVLGVLILEIRACPPIRRIRPVAHPRRRHRGHRGHPGRQRPVADRDGRPSARRGDRSGGSHPDRGRLDARGLRRRQWNTPARPPRVLSARRVVPDRAAGRLVQLRAACPDEKPAAGPGVPLQIPTLIAERHGLQLGEELRIPGLPPGSAHLGSDVPGVRPRRGHQRRLRAAGPVRGRRREHALLAWLRHRRIRPSETGR